MVQLAAGWIHRSHQQEVLPNFLCPKLPFLGQTARKQEEIKCVGGLRARFPPGRFSFCSDSEVLWNSRILVHPVLPQCIKLKPREASAPGFSVVITLIVAPERPVISASLAGWECRKLIAEVPACPPWWGGSQHCSLPCLVLWVRASGSWSGERTDLPFCCQMLKPSFAFCFAVVIEWWWGKTGKRVLFLLSSWKGWGWECCACSCGYLSLVFAP